MFLDWLRAPPQYSGEPPVEAFFRFAAERFPCPAPKGGKGR
jgi:hypothetical protein